MKNYMEFKQSYIFSSDPAVGATNISADGSSFEILLEQPIVVPRNAKNCYITVQSATCWWNFFNVEFEVNDQIDVEYDDGINPVINATITVEPGLYDLDHLSSELGREMLAAGLPQDLFVLVPDQASQKVVIQFNYSGVQLDTTIARNFATLIGFDERLIPLVATTGVQFEKGDSVANFNVVEYILIHSDLVSRGIRINARYSNVIAQILIDKPIGSQLISTPQNPPAIAANELISEKRKNLRFWLTDQNDTLLNTRGELFSVRLVIHYSVPIE